MYNSMFRRLTASALPTAFAVVHGLSVRYCVSIKVPVIAESISTGKVVNWSKKVGDPVVEDEIICQIESDKLNVDVRAPANGIITKINYNDGDDVEVGA